MSLPDCYSVFLGSSIFLTDERLAFCDVMDALGSGYAEQGTLLDTIVCETESTVIRAGGTQHGMGGYDERIDSCDLAIFLCAGALGKYTRGECEVALAARTEKGAPDVVMLVKEGSAQADHELASYLERIASEGAAIVTYGTTDDLRSLTIMLVCDRLCRLDIALTPTGAFLDGCRLASLAGMSPELASTFAVWAQDEAKIYPFPSDQTVSEE